MERIKINYSHFSCWKSRMCPCSIAQKCAVDQEQTQHFSDTWWRCWECQQELLQCLGVHAVSTQPAGCRRRPQGKAGRQAGRQELWLGAGYCGENIGLFPSTQYMGLLWDHLCFAEDQPGAPSTCAVSVGSAGFHLQCVLVVYDPLHRWNVHLWAELVAGYFPHGLCSRPFGWAKGGSLLCWWWFQRFFLAIL